MRSPIGLFVVAFWLAVCPSICVNGQAWSSPELLDAGNPNITLTQLENRMGINMQEEIPWPFTLVKINYNGDDTPYVLRWTYGTSRNFQLSFQKAESTWDVIVTNRQDYENPDQQRYDFEIAIRSETKTVRIIINTINIIDNVPRLSYDGPCAVEELQSNIDTMCRFSVYHPDGTNNNPFTMSIQGRYGESTKFGFTEAYNVQPYSRDYNLTVIEELHFEQRSMYNFHTTASDVEANNSTIVTLLQVIDVENMPPMWTRPFTTARFPEKTAQEFDVFAVDGDTDIAKDIWYDLRFIENENYSDLISIDKTTGHIEVKPIDRDALNQEIFPFYIVAYKFDNRSWSIEGEAVLIVDDINDNSPVVNMSPKYLRIMEATYLTLPIDSLVVNDIDLGAHATYSVSLDAGETTIAYAQPFLMIPDNGYKESHFTITIANATFLDYELPEWQLINLTVLATEHNNTEHIGKFDFQIELINWNDELPIFEKNIYEIHILETTGKDVNLIEIAATDRDIGDHVKHSFVGLSDLLITEDGQIWTTVDRTFDYERQPIVIYQIQATDTLAINGITALHTAYAQLHVYLEDVNDKTPEMHLPRNSPNMDENEQAPYIVTTDGIIVTDPDTTADIRFTIDWDQTYATKSGQEAPKSTYQNCFLIDANVTDPHRVIGHVVVNPEFPLLIDYEEYEVIYLYIIATDHNQEINEDSTEAVLTIRINDVNDNYPLFILDTLTTPRSVIEEAAPGSLVGTIFAHDIDGPKYNKITFSMIPFGSTPDGYVDINEVNGELRVALNAKIGCDVPKIFNLTYVITLSDGELTTTNQVNIWIHDINNKEPKFGEIAWIVEKYENITTGESIQRILATDADRDEPNNVIQYSIDFSIFPALGQYIQIDAESGLVAAQLQGSTVFDRDRGFKSFDIQIVIRDNYQGNGRINQDSKLLKLVLLDVNDNAPQLPTVDTFKPVVSEFADKGSPLDTITAIDIDDETTDNARIGYAILKVSPLSGNAQPAPNADDLFEIDEQNGTIHFKQPARGFYGQWAVQIEAYDHGHLWTSHIQLRSTETYTVTIEPYNFHAPVIVSPDASSGLLLFRLSFYDQQITRSLMLLDGTPFPPFEANDPDGGIFGDVTFELASFRDNTDSDHFALIKDDSKSAHIYLQRPIEAKLYHLNIRASDGGGRRSEWLMNMTLIFVDMSGEPVFDLDMWHTDFTENITGLDERRTIPIAIDPKNIGVEDESLLVKVYYFIDPTYRSNDARLFKLDAEKRELSLTEQLDRESIDNHIIRVVATNLISYPPNPKESAMLTINITVNDVNDNPPQFEYPSYGSGITMMDLIGKHVLTVQAFDPDLDDVITYYIQPGSYSSSDSSLSEIVENNPFEVHPDNGEVILNFAVLSTMKGYIEFKITAFDLVNHTDVCDVKIFIIAESNRVDFLFQNPISYVDLQRERIGKLLSQLYEYTCNVDDITKMEINGVAQEQMTRLRAHFISNNEAIEKSVIVSRSNEMLFHSSLRSALLVIGINLNDIPNINDDDKETKTDEVLMIVLAAISGILGAILAVLIIFFTVRERSLSRQLKALTTTEYEPESKSSKREPPNTNVFAVQGLNDLQSPGSQIYGADTRDVQQHQVNDGVVFDNLSLISTSSNQSDFVGIENDPTFIASGKATGANVAVINNAAFGQNKKHSTDI